MAENLDERIQAIIDAFGPKAEDRSLDYLPQASSPRNLPRKSSRATKKSGGASCGHIGRTIGESKTGRKSAFAIVWTPTFSC
jgi:hypothetical protein